MNSESTFEVLKKLFKVLSVQIPDKDIREEILKYHGTDRLKSVSKMLNYWKISAVIKKRNNNELVGINVPFLAQLDNRLVLVNKFAETEIIIYDGKLSNHKLTPQEFAQYFNGQVIEISSQQHPGGADYISNYRKELANRIRIPVFLIGLVLMLLLYVITNAIAFNTFYIWTILILKLAGLSISIILLLQMIDEDNSLIRGICGADKKKNCNAILSSDAANITEELSWSEVGFFYFAGSLVVLLLNPGDQVSRMFLLLINIVSLPYTCYSIYYQWRIARQWCVLCCLIQVVLWLEFFTFLTSYPLFRYPDFKEATRVIIGFSIPILAWIFFKPFLLSSKLVSALNRLKYNEAVFIKFLHESEHYEQMAENDRLIIGNPNATTLITMIANPYCRHCARVYKSLNIWLPTRKDIQLQLIFATGNDKDKIQIATDIMSIYLSGNSKLTRQAVKAWFGQRHKWYRRWAQKYIAPENDYALTAVQRQSLWCKEANIYATPILLINGFKLPSLYRVDDLKYLI